MKILNKIKDNKSWIILNSVLILAAVILCLVFPIKQFKDYSVPRFFSDLDYDFLIYGDTTAIQGFSCTEEDIDIIELQMRMISDDMSFYGFYNVKLMDSDSTTLIQQWTNQKGRLTKEDKEAVEFELDKPLIPGKEYFLVVSAPDLKEDTAVVLKGTLSPFDVITDEDITYNAFVYGEKFYEGFIYIPLAKERPNYLAVWAILLVIISANVIYFNKDKCIERYSWAVMLLLGLAFIMIMAPGSGADEDYHYTSALVISNALLGREDITCINEDYEFNRVQGYNLNDYFVSEINGLRGTKADGDMIITANRMSPLNHPLSHLFPAIGISIGQLMNVNGEQLYLLARLFNLFGYIFISQIAIRTLMVKKDLMFLFAINPMAIHQATQLSYDVVVVALSYIFIAIIVNVISGKKQLTLWDLCKLFVLIVLFAPIKVVYVAHILLLLAVPISSYKEMIKSCINKDGKEIQQRNIVIYKILSIVVAIAVCIVGFIFLKNILMQLGLKENNHDIYNVKGFFEEPALYCRVLISFICVRTVGFITEAFGYALGQRTLYIHDYIIWIYIALLLLITFSNESKDDNYLTRRGRYAFFAGALIEVLLVYLAGFIMTPYGKSSLEGVQGRYFMPCLLPLVFAIRNSKIVVNIKNNQLYYVACYVYIAIIVYVMNNVVFVI